MTEEIKTERKFMTLKYLKKEELNLTEDNSNSDMRSLVESSQDGDIFVCALSINSPVKVEMIEKYESSENVNNVVRFLEEQNAIDSTSG